MDVWMYGWIEHWTIGLMTNVNKIFIVTKVKVCASLTVNWCITKIASF